MRDFKSEKDQAVIAGLKITCRLTLGMWVASGDENNSQPKANKKMETPVLWSQGKLFCQQPDWVWNVPVPRISKETGMPNTLILSLCDAWQEMAATSGNSALNGMHILVKPLYFSEPPFLLLHSRKAIIPAFRVASRIEKEHTLEYSLEIQRTTQKWTKKWQAVSLVLCLNLPQILIYLSG